MSTTDSSELTPVARLTIQDLDQLVRTHASRLANFLRRRVGNPHDVEDLVQDTLVEALRCIEQFQGQSRPETWLFGIALNLTRGHYKRARCRDVYVDADVADVPSEGGDNPMDITEQRQRMTRVAAVLPSLPEDSRQMLERVVIDNLSYEEVALEMNIPIGTVRSRISRARAHLKRQIEASPDLTEAQEAAPKPMKARASDLQST
ncbi:RNA polymerase sigma factor, sigma-70 family [Roseateles sp. YR242]|uniref:RNA polymerase sigma factor n=1 Tax=Roseateles sp. YR242 TaxID=1855305 RepID=UPI0008D1D18B|nr:sigma-70 family RNA polymerase sigma factor [Roseateles sp. YR242]SEK64755.1 RNA polymerase sigma factor, sigma-70 family [Roseateles sp. YR242]